MTVLEAIIQGVQNLPEHDQVDVARYVHRLNLSAQQARTEVLRQTHGALDEADGDTFEQAMKQARHLDTRG